jgi:hypothetical protein
MFNSVKTAHRSLSMIILAGFRCFAVLRGTNLLNQLPGERNTAFSMDAECLTAVY